MLKVSSFKTLKMSDNSKIAWTDATWSPIVGCSKISTGCNHCYAEVMARRLAGMPQQSPKYSTVIHEGKWSGIVFMDFSALEKPLSWKKPRMIFVCSMGDLFHESVLFNWILEIMYVINKCPQHTFQILTKRPDRMHEFFTDWIPNPFSLQDGDLPNLHLGVTAENQEQADKRIPVLLDIPAAKRFVSIEPMLGPIDIGSKNSLRWSNKPLIEQLDQVIVGGETGHSARPMHPAWVTNIRDQCIGANVPFFFKSWGEWKSINQKNAMEDNEAVLGFNGETYIMTFDPQAVIVRRIGKKKAGHLIEGKEWKGMP